MGTTCDQWQYRSILCQRDDRGGFVCGDESASADSVCGKPFGLYVQELGELGWELATVSPVDDNSTGVRWQYIFKRPAEAQCLDWFQVAGLAKQLISAPVCIRQALFALSSPRADDRTQAVETLWQADEPLAAEVLTYALHHPVSGVRDRAACALGMRGDARGQPQICRILQRVEETPSQTSLLAMAAAVHLGDRESLLAVRDYFKRQSSAKSATSALLHVVAKGNMKLSADFLLDLLDEAKREGPFDSAVPELLEELASQQDASMVDAILSVYDSPSTGGDHWAAEKVRKSVIETVGTLASAAAVPWLIAIVMQTTDYEEGEQAADSLRKIATEEGLLAADRWDVRKESIERPRRW